VPEDHKEAARLWRLVAERGHAGAQYSLGRCYALGQGALLDNDEAVRWFRLSAEQGQAQAQFRLGNCYCVGIGVPEDDQTAARYYYRLAARQGHAGAH